MRRYLLAFMLVSSPTLCCSQTYDQQQGPIVSPHGGAAGGSCYGPNCGLTTDDQRSSFGPQVSSHGGAYGGTCYGPNC